MNFIDELIKYKFVWRKINHKCVVEYLPYTTDECRVKSLEILLDHFLYTHIFSYFDVLVGMVRLCHGAGI